MSQATSEPSGDTDNPSWGRECGPCAGVCVNRIGASSLSARPWVTRSLPSNDYTESWPTKPSRLQRQRERARNNRGKQAETNHYATEVLIALHTW